jgi:hypothetical protein
VELTNIDIRGSLHVSHFYVLFLVFDPTIVKVTKENSLEISGTEPFMIRNSQEWYCNECRKHHGSKAGCSK